MSDQSILHGPSSCGANNTSKGGTNTGEPLCGNGFCPCCASLCAAALALVESVTFDDSGHGGRGGNGGLLSRKTIAAADRVRWLLAKPCGGAGNGEGRQ